MNALIAPNAFKGSLTAREAATIMAGSLPGSWHSILCPIADGGDGTLECLVNARGGEFFAEEVTGPLPGRKVPARWGILGDKRTAVIEMAEAAGIRLIPENHRSAATTTTRGVGELIGKALDAGLRTIVVGLGGSATNDGGAGCLQALGVRFLDRNGAEVPEGGIHLQNLQSIDVSGIDSRIAESEIVCLVDVDNPLLGPSGATRTFGAQKGATPEEIEALERAMRHYHDIASRQISRDAAPIAGSGAAGGLAAGLHLFCNARIVSGITYVLDTIGFDVHLRSCDIVLTGEGSLDRQTLHGKGIAGIAMRATRSGKPVHVFAGRVKGDPNLLVRDLGLTSIHELAPPTIDNTEAMSQASELLAASIKAFLSSFPV
jgi:glycerate kinase